VLGFATNWVVARIGAEVLGYYTLVGVITIGVANNVLLLGSGNVIINYFPLLRARQRGGFLLQYFGMAAIAAVALYGILLLFPQAVEFFYGRPASALIYALLAILTPLAMLNGILGGALAGALRMEWAAAIAVMGGAGILCTLGGLHLAQPSLLLERPLEVCVAVFSIWLLLQCVLQVAVSARADIRFGEQVKATKLTNFWRFTLTTHLGTVGFFVGQTADQVLASALLGVGELGQYRVALVLLQALLFLPMAASRAIYPTLRYLQVSGATERLDRQYRLLCHLLTAMVGLCGLCLCLFGREALAFFGRSYAAESFASMLILIIPLLAVAPLAIINGALLTAREMTGQTALINCLSAVFSVSLGLALIPRWGMPGAACAFLAGYLCLALGGIWVLWRKGTYPPSRTLVLGIVAAVLAIPWTPVFQMSLVWKLIAIAAYLGTCLLTGTHEQFSRVLRRMV